MTQNFVTFVDTPPFYRKYNWAEITQTLREHPGQWAEVGGDVDKTDSSAQQAAQSLARGSVKGTNKGDFETTTRGSKMYARYIGNREAAH